MPMTKTKTELLKDARSRCGVTATELSRQSPGSDLDVASNRDGRRMLAGARHVPRGFLELRVEELFRTRRGRGPLLCGGPDRSWPRDAADMGYTRVRSLAAIFAWKERASAGRARALTTRSGPGTAHLLIPEVARQAAKRFKSKVLLTERRAGIADRALLGRRSGSGSGSDDDVVTSRTCSGRSCTAAGWDAETESAARRCSAQSDRGGTSTACGCSARTRWSCSRSTT